MSQVPGCTRFTSLRLNRKGTLLLTASLDRSSRLFTVDLSTVTGGAHDGLTVSEAQEKIQALQKVRRLVGRLKGEACCLCVNLKLTSAHCRTWHFRHHSANCMSG